MTDTTLDRLKSAAAKWVVRRPIRIHWTRRDRDSWLARNYPGPFVTPPLCASSRRIEDIAASTDALGEKPLWDGYPARSGARSRRANEVRTSMITGNFFADLVERRRPEVVVEFGTAFGVSGMYWLAGLESLGAGELLTFEPNAIWAEIARRNLADIGSRFALCVGTFEQNIDACLAPGRSIDIAFVDAIHTREFVVPQVDLVVRRSAPGSLILIDDIEYSDDMRKCWDEIAATDRRFSASATLGRRVGLLELAR